MATQLVKKERNTAYYINSVISIAITIVFWFIPAPAPLTPIGMRIIGALFGAIWGWINCEIIWPSFIAIVDFCISGYAANGNGALNLIGGNATTLYILALFAFAGLFVYTNTAPVLAQKIIGWKVARGKPWTLSLVLMLSVFVPALIVGGVPALLIGWNIVYAICDEVGFEKGDKWPTIMLVFFVFVGSCGYGVLPMQAANATNIGYITTIAPTLKINYVSFITVTLLYSVLTITGFTLFLKYIAKPDVSKLLKYKSDKPAPDFNFEQKACLGLFVVMFVILMLQGVIPGTPLGKYLGSLGNCCVVVFVLGIAFIMRKNGKPIASFKQIASDMPWTPIVMMATAMALGATFSDKKTGINDWLGKVLGPVFAGFNPYVLCVMIIIFTIILCQFARGAATSYVIQPIIFSFHKTLPTPLMLGTMVAVMCISAQGIFFPHSSTNASLVHSNIEWLKEKDILKYAAVGSVTVLIAILIAAVGVGSFIM